jgi:hypothetical protein
LKGHLEKPAFMRGWATSIGYSTQVWVKYYSLKYLPKLAQYKFKESVWYIQRENNKFFTKMPILGVCIDFE